MRNLKKILAMALTVLMVVGSFAMTATAAFDDVTDYQEAIEVMAALGIAAGKSETEFAPDDDVTREEMALWIAKIMTGKVAADYVTNNFLGAVENLTAFADLDEDNYVGAINYASNNGIIVGTSATTFEPAEAIKIQDVFAMVVRMLGYGSTAMNNNYPWSFIDKAISLGLDADLPADYSNEAVASRGETMQILYNALTALKSDGSTLGYDFFGLEKATVVITGTSEGNAYSGAELIKKTVDGEEYISFAVLGANGNVSDTTYYALKSAFGIEGDAQLYVGRSYVVRTIDGFASFLTFEANGYEVVDQDAITGAPKHAINKTHFDNKADRYVDIEGNDYKLVKAYSNFNGVTKTNNDYEIIMVNADGERETVLDFNSYVMDTKLNILDENGNVLLEWRPTYGEGVTSLNGVYLYQIGVNETTGEPIYVQPNDYIWSLAAKASIVTSNDYGFAVIEDSFCEIEEKDAYSDTVLFDDDNDGDYDRGIYYQYKFGYIDNYSTTINGVAYPWLRLNMANGIDPRAKTVNAPHHINDTKYFDAEGNVLEFADIKGKYVLYHYNPLYKTMIVKEIFEGQTGLVTGIDLVNKTMTLNAFGANILTGVVAGETYALGNEKLAGAEYASLYAKKALCNITTATLTETIGKNINFIEKDGKILAIYNAVNDAKHMVYVNDNPGFTTMGYKNILAYYDAAASKIAGTMSVVTVNAMNNYWYSAYVNTAVTGVNPKLEMGALLAATEDSLGNYDISVVSKVSGTYNSTNVITDTDGGVISINNGIVTSDITGIKADGKTAKFAPFKASTATVWIVWGDLNNNGKKEQNEFKSFTGIPTSGSQIFVNANATVYYESAENFVYVDNGSFSADLIQSGSNNPWNTNQNTTIVYVTADTIATMKATNAYQYGMGINVGMTYSYDKALDVVNGGFAKNIMTDYNFNAQLIAGNYYLVENGYVTRIANDMMSDAVLAYADNDSAWGYTFYVDDNNDGKYADSTAEKYAVSNGAFPIVYALESDGSVFYSNWDETNLRNILDDFDVATSKYYAQAKAYAEGYDALNNADGVLDGTPVKVFLGNDIIAFNASAPVFVQAASAKAAPIAKYVATEDTVKSGDIEKKVQFRFYNIGSADLDTKYAFYSVDVNGIDEKIATEFQSATINWAKSATQVVDLGDTMSKTVDGVVTGAADSVYTGKQFAVVVANDILHNYDVKISYRKNATDTDNVTDSSVAFDWDFANVNNSNNSTIFYFTVTADMEYTATETSNDIFVNVLFVAK